MDIVIPVSTGFRCWVFWNSAQEWARGLECRLHLAYQNHLAKEKNESIAKCQCGCQINGVEVSWLTFEIKVIRMLPVVTVVIVKRGSVWVAKHSRSRQGVWLPSHRSTVVRVYGRYLLSAIATSRSIPWGNRRWCSSLSVVVSTRKNFFLVRAIFWSEVLGIFITRGVDRVGSTSVIRRNLFKSSRWVPQAHSDR